MTAAASGTMQWAWMSTVLTRLPLTTTSRRLPCPGVAAPAVFVIAHPINAMPANAPVSNSPPMAITSLLVGPVIMSEEGYAVTLRQRKCDQRVAELSAELAVAAGGDDDELFAAGVQAIGHRQSLCAGRQTALPELRAGLDIERAQIIVHRRSDKDEAARGDDRASEIWRAANDGSGILGDIRRRSQRYTPADSPISQIYSDQRAPGRRIAGQTARRQERAPAHTIGRAVLRRHLGAELAQPGGSLRLVIPLARDQMNFHREVDDIRDKELALRVERPAAPVHTAEIARISQSSLRAGRGEDPFRPQPLHDRAAGVAVFLRRSPGVGGA